MSLQFSVDELIQPLVSVTYQSSDEEMEVDCPSSDTEVDPNDDSDIEVIACYREAPVSVPKTVGGRGMTLDLSSCVDSGSQDNSLCNHFSYFVSEPEDELIDLVLGLHPPTRGPGDVDSHPKSACSQLKPLQESPQSPPPHERGQQTYPVAPRWDQDEPYWPPNSHNRNGSKHERTLWVAESCTTWRLSNLRQISGHNSRGGNFRLFRKNT